MCAVSATLHRSFLSFFPGLSSCRSFCSVEDPDKLRGMGFGAERRVWAANIDREDMVRKNRIKTEWKVNAKRNPVTGRHLIIIC